MNTWPSDTGTSPRRTLHNVDFPEAMGPTTIVSREAGMLSSRFLRLGLADSQPKVPPVIFISDLCSPLLSPCPEPSFPLTLDDRGGGERPAVCRKSTRESDTR